MEKPDFERISQGLLKLRENPKNGKNQILRDFEHVLLYAKALDAEQYGGGLSGKQIQQALTNIGHSTDCGACMEVFYTGVTQATHSCQKSEPRSYSHPCIFCGAPIATEDSAGHLAMCQKVETGSCATCEQPKHEHLFNGTCLIRCAKAHGQLPEGCEVCSGICPGKHNYKGR